MPNSLLIGINAKYIHSNLAIRSIRDFAENHFGLGVNIAEFTINQQPDFILSQIYKKMPDILGFSCYIWNYELIKRLVSELKKILPDTFIFLGGPEVSYDPDQVLKQTCADCVVIGEGEKSCSELICALNTGKPLSSVAGIVWKENGLIRKTPCGPPLSMEDLPFVYDRENLSKLEHRILYYESSRGCPFHCQYCLSGEGSQVRFLPLETVYRHLDFFLSQKVRQVKFVDRTFNCNKRYAMSIWQYLQQHDNGVTNFHFEIAAELLDHETITFLQTVRKGLFQFEIGVQSTNPKTLEQIQRITKIDLLREIISKLQKNKNIHLHLDLIIGLPSEGYDRFSKSFNDVYGLSPDQLQVGFLKLLKGSGLYQDKEKYGIVSSDYAPYEVLYTKDLSYQEILRLKMIEEMVEVYYNSNRFRLLISYLTSLASSPFQFFESLAAFYEEKEYHLCAHSNLEYYTILYQYFQTMEQGDEDKFKEYALFDLYSHEKAKKLPEWLDNSHQDAYKKGIFAFYADQNNILRYLPQYTSMDEKQIYRSAHIQVFSFSPFTGEEKITPVLFNYKNCDLLGNAEHFMIELPTIDTQSCRSN